MIHGGLEFMGGLKKFSGEGEDLMFKILEN